MDLQGEKVDIHPWLQYKINKKINRKSQRAGEKKNNIEIGKKYTELLIHKLNYSLKASTFTNLLIWIKQYEEYNS